MALTCIEALHPTARSQAEELAAQWAVPLCGEASTPNVGVKAVVSELALGLSFTDKKRGKPFYVDFLSQAWRTRLKEGLPKNHIFRRALGLRGEPLRVVDATAGFGQDTMMALSLGCEVTAVEKSPVVLALLRDGVLRARREDEVLHQIFSRLTLLEGDANEWIPRLAPVDVIYLDPMFDKAKKSAKSPKEMQLLQELLAPLPPLVSEEQLLTVALKHAAQRVVVKRPLKARSLSLPPTHVFKGQSIRYDVYLAP